MNRDVLSIRALPKYTLYDTLVDVGQRPDMYNIATMGELKSFVDGYRLAAELHDNPPPEVPPLRQLAEWLVRELDRGNKCFGWWQLIQWEDTDDQTAIAEFARLIEQFAQRLPRPIAHAKIDDHRHAPSGEFRVSYRREGDSEWTDLADCLPTRLQLLNYETDPGVYLEYYFKVDEPYFHEQYFDSTAEAYNEAQRDFHVTASDWKLESASNIDRTMG